MDTSRHISIIANPASQNGKGAAIAAQVYKRLSAAVGPEHVDLMMTQAPNHALELAKQAAAFQAGTIVAVGGDGLAHEVCNGLMELPAQQRPTFGLVPAGCGNDYAGALKLPTKVGDAVDVLLAAKARPLDVGCVNGTYYLETLSFGLDAAIALGTVELRQKSGHSGTRLYLDSAREQLLHHMDPYAFQLQAQDGTRVRYEKGTARAVEDLDPAGTLTANLHLVAVQIGTRYGGGFHICPDARLDDGLLDICIAHAPIARPNAVRIFLMAKGGHHTGCKPIEFLRARKLHLHFEAQPPIQADGERMEGTDFDIACIPGALQVLVPQY
ncbi:MAG: diacylglycerol kinase family lipid kinase [Coriobacteriia bacterium]|nr:diacylglycerol kinase family lipid kinase [Coriobacteriia bacterium]